MTLTRVSSALLLLLLITDVRTQFFDFFGLQPLVQQFQTPKPRHHATTEATTKRHNTRRHSTKKPTTASDNFDRDASLTKQNKRKTSAAPVLDFNYNAYSTTVKPVRKTTKGTDGGSSQRNSNKNSYVNEYTTRNTFYNVGPNFDTTTRRYNFESNEKPTTRRVTSAHKPINYDKPLSSNIADDYYNYTNRYHVETVTKTVHTYYEDDDKRHGDLTNHNANTNNKHSHSSSHNSGNNNNNNYNYNNDYNINNHDFNYNNNERYTTKNPLYHRPGVRPAVIENRPPITNRPLTNRITTNRPQTNRVTTNRPTTKKPVAVYPRPTDSGSIAFPQDEDGPEIISGPDEDYMSEVDKRRYIEMAEKMCDKYKSLNMKQLQAIPLIPSPIPLQVNVTSCAPTNIPLVVGGKVVTINEFPHMALLGWVKVENGGYSWKCGGSLISDQYVLTAAHCAYQERDNTVITGAPRVVQLGSSFLDDPGALVVKIAAVIRHPKFKSPKSYYDLALVKLASSVTFSEVIRPACLGVPPSVGQPIIATGWGQTKFGGDQSVELRSVSLPIWDIESCAEVLGTSRKLPNGPLEENQVCAGEMGGGKDTCQGDSGGPAQLQEGCIWRVVAVTSLGRSCGAPNTPGLYAKVQRAFVAAQVFGGQSNGNRKPDSNYWNSNSRYDNGNRNTNNDNGNENSNRQSNGNFGNGSNRNSDNENVNQNHNVHTDFNRQNSDNLYNQYNNNGRTTGNRYSGIHEQDNQRNNDHSPKYYTTESPKTYNENHNSNGDNYNRYNRQESGNNNHNPTSYSSSHGNSHRQTENNNNHKQTNHNTNINNNKNTEEESYDPQGNNRNTNNKQQQTYNDQQNHRNVNSHGQNDYYHNQNRRNQYENSNSDGNEDYDSRNSGRFFDAPTWWTR